MENIARLFLQIVQLLMSFGIGLGIHKSFLSPITDSLKRSVPLCLTAACSWTYYLRYYVQYQVPNIDVDMSQAVLLSFNTFIELYTMSSVEIILGLLPSALRQPSPS